MNEKKFKCPICGCKEHYLVSIAGYKKNDRVYENNRWVEKDGTPKSILFYEVNTWNLSQGTVDLSAGSNAEAYLCKECGHIDLFSDTLLNYLKRTEEDDRRKQQEATLRLNNLTVKKNTLIASITPKENRVKELGQLLSSEDITIRQQKDYKAELSQLTEELSDLRKQLNALEVEINKNN